MFIALLAGCEHSASRPGSNLPTGAKNLRTVGGGWVLFDLDIDGRSHTFMHGEHGFGQTRTETITEVAR